MSALWAVVMAGGAGTRFWPVSTEARPKQFLPPGGGVPGENPKPSLLALTLARLRGLVARENTLVAAAAAHEEWLRDLDVPAENLIREPAPRNTAPCLGLAARLIEEKSPGAVLCALPADHFIDDAEAFRDCIRAGAELARGEGAIITLGVTPRAPETGFGYIERGAALGDSAGAFRVKRFVEKPTRTRARAYAASGKHYWNSGILIVQAARLIQELDAHLPATSALLAQAASAYQRGEHAAFAALFNQCEAVSIDHAVMEKARDVLVLPAGFGWSDLGAWTALRDILPQDGSGNLWMLPEGSKAAALDTRNLLVRANKKVVAALGVENLIVVETEDALLVCANDAAQRVGALLDNLRRERP